MTLGQKLVVSLSALAAVYVGALVHVHERYVVDSLEVLERLEAERDLDRVEAAFEDELDSLGVLVRDWAVWDSSYAYALGRAPEFVAENLTYTSVENAELCGIVYVGLDGAVLHSVAVGDGAEALTLERLEASALALHERCREAPEMDAPTGAFLWEAAPLFVAALPIRNTDATEAPAGTLVMARALSPERLARMRARTHVGFVVGTAVEAEAWSAEDGELVGTLNLAGLDGAPTLGVTVRVPREISRRGHAGADSALAASVIGFGVLILGVYVLLRREVVRPLEELAADAVRIGTGERDERVSVPARRDEIGALARELDLMTQRVATSRKELAATSRKAGRAEVTASILHNVGNGLNVVHVSAGLIRERVRESEARGQLGQLMELVTAEGAGLADWLRSDPRGAQFPAAFVAVAGTVLAELEDVADESARLAQGVEHVRRVLDRQRQIHSTRALSETFELDELLGETEQLARLNGRVVRPTVVRSVSTELEGVRTISAAKHRILEVLVNLVNNAADALRDAGTTAPRIELRAHLTRDGVARFDVRDNGPGVPEHARASLFRFGFTTKEDGSGIGLHTSANIATELGGTLSFVPTTAGVGATFRLEVPFELPAAWRAAA